MRKDDQNWRLDGQDITLVFAQSGPDNIDLVYFGRSLVTDEDLDALVQSGIYGLHENQPDDRVIGGFLPNLDAGYRGTAALRLQRSDHALDTRFKLTDVRAAPDAICFIWYDQKNELELQLRWEIRRADMVYSRYMLENRGSEVVYASEMAALMLPLPVQFDEITHFDGRWAAEMVPHCLPLNRGTIELASYGGKAGFSSGDWLVFTGCDSKDALGYHFAWSGDHRTRIETNEDGRTMLIGGCAPEKSPIPIQQNEIHQTPVAMFTLAQNSDELTTRFHRHVRSKDVLGRDHQTAPRRVHLNSWEALGFEMDETKLQQLANDAAGLGVERFVVDDGWFTGRRSDKAGLGDWTVDTGLFPHGLNPLINHVKSLGMDFGLWVEPEMVSPNSDLYRNHPDWCIHNDKENRPTERGQLVLDLSRPGVTDYLYDKLDKLLNAYDIAYLKWDHNRRLFPSACRDGAPEYQQVTALYALLDRLKNAHPDVEIESCSSGGGRIDLAILNYCDRVWPSDNNDAIERLRIMDGWTRFLPLDVLGNHVGPSPNPITGRCLSMDFRAKTAMFGHMGVEANPVDMSIEERAILSAHIAHYKQWREILHQGDFQRIDHPEPTVFGQMAVHGDKAIAMVAQTAFAKNFNVAPVKLEGLEPSSSYRITLLEPWPSKASSYLAMPEKWTNGMTLSGRAIGERGLALPLTHPETAWLISLEKL